MNVQNESMYFNEIPFVLLRNVPPPHLYHNYWAHKHLQNLAKRPFKSDDNTY